MAPPLPAVIGGRYKPLGLLGEGGMGAVYEAQHLRTGERVALKLLHASIGRNEGAVQRFTREARASAAIKSEHVVRVIDADVAEELEGAPYLVMELLDGADLERVSGSTPQSPEDVVEWLRQVARGLDKAHAVSIVHRDLKPENLFLTKREDGTPFVKILDFGIAKMAVEAGVSTQSGQVLGTPRYMAPEQARGQSSVGPPTDLFSLGLIAFRLLVGETYFTGDTMAELVTQLIVDRMPPPSERGSKHGADFDAWFERACARSPAERFPSAGEQVEALAAALGLPTRSLQPVTRSSGAHDAGGLTTMERAATIEATTLPTPTTPPGRSRAVLGVAALALVASAVAAVAVSGRGTQAPAVTTPTTVQPSAAASTEPAPPASTASTANPVAVTPVASASARPARSAEPPPGARTPKTAPVKPAAPQAPPKPDPLGDQK